MLARRARAPSLVAAILLLLLGGCEPAAAELPHAGTLAVIAAPMPQPEPALVPAAEPPESAPPACPPEMVLVEGSHCPEPLHRCLGYLDESGRFRHARCAEYERPARCAADRRQLRFCIDRDEYVVPGSDLPLTGRSMHQAARLCAEAGKRLCRESEWDFACEGEEMRPYPYGWVRDARACNADKPTLVGTDGVMVSLAQPVGSHPRCVSPFGVRDMTGNVEEWVVRDDRPARGAMKGAYWLPTHNHCRAAQRIHGPGYSGSELGFRCCSEARASRTTN